MSKKWGLVIATLLIAASFMIMPAKADVKFTEDSIFTVNTTATGYICNTTTPSPANCRTLLQLDTDTDTTISNCSVGSSCSNVAYDTEIPSLETDPLWQGNFSGYNNGTWDMAVLYVTNGTFYLATNPYGFYNISDFDISNYDTRATTIGYGYYNGSDFVITDYVTRSELYGYNYYNLSNFDINDYYTEAHANKTFYTNLTNFTGTLTDTKLCRYDATNDEIDCDYTDISGGGGTSLLMVVDGWVIANETAGATNYTRWDGLNTTEGRIDNLTANISLIRNETFSIGNALWWLADVFTTRLTAVNIFATTIYEGGVALSSKYLLAANEGNLNTNSSDYWDNLGGLNGTQFEDDSGELHLLDTFFSNFFDTLFGTKDTDDLTEGASNKYDNQTWNEPRAASLFINATDEANLNVNSSDYWDNFDTPADFTDLETDGSLSNDVVAAAEMADADHGDVSWSSGVATVQNFTIAADVQAQVGSGHVWYNSSASAIQIG